MSSYAQKHSPHVEQGRQQWLDQDKAVLFTYGAALVGETIKQNIFAIKTNPNTITVYFVHCLLPAIIHNQYSTLNFQEYASIVTYVHFKNLDQ